MTNEPGEYGYILRFPTEMKCVQTKSKLKLKPLSFEFSVPVQKSNKTGDLLY